jgi:hypothetical protein
VVPFPGSPFAIRDFANVTPGRLFACDDRRAKLRPQFDTSKKQAPIDFQEPPPKSNAAPCSTGLHQRCARPFQYVGHTIGCHGWR